jgi:outer membrane lipoprotein carrier protein
MNCFSRRTITSSLLITAALFAAPVSAHAQSKKVPSKPVGAWNSKVSETDGNKSRTLTQNQMKSIEAVNTYFNKVNNLKGSFSQTNPDKKVQRGKFYLKRPGRFRFDYNRPSRQVIVSDGKYLAIQDHDLKNEDVYGLENTPFRILLRKDVDLLRDARIMAVEQSATQIAVTITDKSPDSPGQITIYITPAPDSKLAGWVTTDVQGGVTKVLVSNLKRPEKLDRNLFVREKIFMKSIQ